MRTTIVLLKKKNNGTQENNYVVKKNRKTNAKFGPGGLFKVGTIRGTMDGNSVSSTAVFVSIS